ncbi:MAG: hypothetical protein Q8R64_12390, partial [Sulfurimicrobium sp.]|nr:hypothetical protein [Sulfurimicrobium sp.]
MEIVAGEGGGNQEQQRYSRARGKMEIQRHRTVKDKTTIKRMFLRGNIVIDKKYQIAYILTYQQDDCAIIFFICPLD